MNRKHLELIAKELHIQLYGSVGLDAVWEAHTETELQHLIEYYEEKLSSPFKYYIT